MPARAAQTDRQNVAFASTRWTVVRQASDSHSATQDALAALSDLCRVYWRPIFVFLRRQGFGPEDAEDLTQAFFTELIESRAYARADREKGRFRCFLLGTLKHFIAHAHARERAQKRGGGRRLLPLDGAALEQAESRMAAARQSPPELLFDREWAATLLRHVMQRLEEEWALAGKDELFRELRPLVSVSSETMPAYEELALRLARPLVTVRSDVARLRARYREILLEEVRGTVTANESVEEELRYLREVLAT